MAGVHPKGDRSVRHTGGASGPNSGIKICLFIRFFALLIIRFPNSSHVTPKIIFSD